PTISAELRASLYSPIVESIFKAIAAFCEQPLSVSEPSAHEDSDSNNSHMSDHDKTWRKRPWKGDSASAGKGKAPAKSTKLSSAPSVLQILEPLEGLTSHQNLQVLDEYYADYSDEDFTANMP
ncbi:Hypothetical predicted protein, partial [Pelobates cultripes]